MDSTAQRLRSAHSGLADWRAAVDGCVRDLGPLAPGANLGFVYASDHHAAELAALLARLRAATGVAHWVGTVGLGVCANGTEYFDTPALAIMAGAFPEGSFRVVDAGAAGAAQTPPRAAPAFAVVHGDPRNPDIATQVAALSRGLDDAFLVGGLTSSRGDHPQVADGITSGGLSGVVFDARVRVATRLTQGCTPFGPRHEITRCTRNVIETLDARPALEVLHEDVGELLARQPARIAGSVFAGLPIAGSDTGDYLVRNLVGIDEERALVAIAELVSPGDGLMFCRRDATAAEQDLRRILDELARAADAAPKGAVYHTCLARGPNLFGPGSRELGIVADALGDVPLVGFFGNGEISHHRLYGYTGVLTLFL